MPSLPGERKRVAIVALGLFREIAAGGDLAEKEEGRRFVRGRRPPSRARVRARPAHSLRVLEPVGEHVRFTQRAPGRTTGQVRCPIVSKALSPCCSNEMPSAIRPERA